ncbi:toll/interleukin-1 receptor domain-containing protein [Amycolatopsis sp. Hca4]|uniref:toll/interleukin-1 receptor domain-containing protein n=1 Tax=Amycolatopsis sp. Hca4 TaxID=2742131 RepID=UPI0015913D52|nr:toll/interleukin-1 receptor domain-containing protein [Amycolatopsis sp. Hca4]QKV79937.1 toll/interleukin-1 receptor domain-containing protein [Amycolatopsis sp. Hca4]
MTAPSVEKPGNDARGRLLDEKWKVFVSYSAGGEAAEVVAKILDRLADGLGPGYDVFVDRSLRLAGKWSRELDDELRRAHYGIVLLSEAAARSDWVLRESDRMHFRQIPIFVLLIGITREQIKKRRGLAKFKFLLEYQNSEINDQ